jgi:hypothetical protein
MSTDGVATAALHALHFLGGHAIRRVAARHHVTAHAGERLVRPRRRRELGAQRLHRVGLHRAGAMRGRAAVDWNLVGRPNGP